MPVQGNVIPIARRTAIPIFLTTALAVVWAQGNAPQQSNDAVMQAQRPAAVPVKRVEQKKTDHDRSDRFMATKAQPISPVLSTQPKQGKISGFDFYRDPLNADRPFQSPEEIMKKEMADKPNVMKAQQDLLERRYTLEPKL